MSIGSSGATKQTARRSVEQGPRFPGMRPRRRAWARDSMQRALARSRVAPTRERAGTAPPSAGLLAATRRDGALWAHFVVGNPCNIDILLRILLLKLHPTSPPSHTCLPLR